MVFGFNTDVKHQDTIYHVQSEAREADLLLQTQVFVRGRCIGKRAKSYASKAAEPGFGDSQKEHELREQHRLVLDAIREGKLDSVLDKAELENLAGTKELDVQWLNAQSVHAERNLTMQLKVTEGGSAAHVPLCASERRAILYASRDRLRGGCRDQDRGRGIRSAGRFFVGAGQLRRADDYAQICTAQGRSAAGLKYLCRRRTRRLSSE